MLRLYHTAAAGGNILSRAGSWGAFDEAIVDGTSGESERRKLYLAPAQTALTDAIVAHSAGDIIEIRIDHPVFDSAGYPIIIIGTEKFLVIDGGGHGTRQLRVEAGRDSTTAVAHAAAAAVIQCYDYTGISIGRTGDNASRLTFSATESGSYASSLARANIDHIADRRLIFVHV
ncbi:hypothetical protein LCGC14_2980970, partial [marine sediment metagenome]